MCFCCSEKFHPGHRCKICENRELNVLIAGGSDEREEQKVTAEEEVTELRVVELEEKAEVSLRSLLGFSRIDTMKLLGEVKQREVVILIDCRATHNFIHRSLAEELELPFTRTVEYGVVIGNGNAINGHDVCQAVTVKVAGLEITTDLLPIDLGQMDIILGMQWLCTTGFMGVHWPTLTMSFMVGANQVILKGDPALTKSEVSLKAFS